MKRHHSQSNDRNVSVNSTPNRQKVSTQYTNQSDITIHVPEKRARNRKCTRPNRCKVDSLSAAEAFVVSVESSPLEVCVFSVGVAANWRVSGRATTRRTISTRRRIRLSNAGVAYTFNSRLGDAEIGNGCVENHAPIGGPICLADINIHFNLWYGVGKLTYAEADGEGHAHQR